MITHTDEDESVTFSPADGDYLVSSFCQIDITNPSQIEKFWDPRLGEWVIHARRCGIADVATHRLVHQIFGNE